MKDNFRVFIVRFHLADNLPKMTVLLILFCKRKNKYKVFSLFYVLVDYTTGDSSRFPIIPINRDLILDV